MKISRQRFLTTCMFGLLTLYVAAQTTFSTERLQHMAKQLNLVQLDTLKPAAFTDSYTYKGNKLHVAKNKRGEICHIGFAMVNPELRNSELQPLINFVERYLLELDLPSDFSIVVRLNRDKVIYHVAEDIIPAKIGYDDGFALEVEALKSYRISWQRDGQTILQMAFPMDAQLLLGCNVIELETNLVKHIVSVSNERTKRSEFSVDALKGKGDTFLDPLISNKLYTKEVNGQLDIIFNSSNMHQSVCNFALTGYAPTLVPLNFTVDLYGYKKKELQLSYSQLVRFLNGEGCTLYFGIKTRSETMVEGTLFAVQKSLGYCHVVKLEIPTSIINPQPEGMVNARFYAYIPLHNISSDYF